MSQFANFMSMQQRGLDGVRINEIVGAQVSLGPKAASEEILTLLSSDPAAAARKALRHAEQCPDPSVFAQAARRLIFTKATDAHDFKYAAAIFEDYQLVQPKWRPHMLATAVYHLRGTDMPDSAVMQRALDSVKSL